MIYTKDGAVYSTKKVLDEVKGDIVISTDGSATSVSGDALGEYSNPNLAFYFLFCFFLSLLEAEV